MSSKRLQKEPMNVSLLDVNAHIQANGCLPIVSHMIHEPGTNQFHPEGLFSEIIFDQIGSPQRLIRFAYLDLKTKIFQPLIYKNLMSLKSFYDEILAGRCYVTFDRTEKDFVRVSPDDPNGNTGFSYFMKYFPELKFKETGSLKRSDKIKIMKKYKDSMFIDRYLVLPAGVRDIREDDGMLASEDINKLYLAVLSMAGGLPDTDGEINPAYDSLRYSIQRKIVEIYDYIFDIIDGKGGYQQSKFGARNVALGTRNVITAAPITEVTSPRDADYFRNDEALLPLYQVAKAATPLIAYTLRTAFFNVVFPDGASSVALIDPKTLKLEYTDIDEEQKSLFTTSDGIEKLINLLRNEFIRDRPVSVLSKSGEKKWMYLVYDEGDTIQTTRNVTEFKSFLANEDNWSIHQYKESLDKLTTLGVMKEEMVIVGSCALVVRGYPFGSEDMDIVVSPRVYERLAASGSFEKTDRSLVFENIEIYTDNPGYHTYEETNTQIDTIEGYKVANLDSMYANYKEANRPKDQKKLKWLSSHIFDPSKLRALTYGEMFYIATYSAMQDKYTTLTRYPILNEVGIIACKIHIQTTTPSRKVYFKMTIGDYMILLPRYPVLNSAYQDSMCPHPSTLPGFDGDYDGDVASAIPQLSMEANKEIAEYFQKPLSMVNTSNRLYRGLVDDAMIKFSFWNLGYMPS